jgi:tetratricopeptide (TPR) repeat protein
MAPEQLARREATPRSDQFSFCVMLFEALYGERPFPGDHMAAIADSIAAGRMVPPPDERPVPARVHAVVLRGLAADPEARWPSMDALIDALAAAAEPRRRWRWAAVAAVVAAAAAAAVIGTRTNAAADAVCAGSAGELAGVWDPAQRIAVARAFAATNLPYAADTAARVERALDDVAQRWTAAHTRTCRATRIHKSQTETVMQARMTCLDQRRRELRALVGVFAHADAAVVEHAITAAAAFGAPGSPTSVEACDAAELVPAAPALDPATQAEADRLADRLAEGRARVTAGHPREALVIAGEVVPATRALGVAPLHADALLLQANAQEGGERAATEATLEEAVWAAERAGDPARRARAWLELVEIAEPAVAAVRIRHADAVLSHVPADDELHTRLLTVRANTAQRAGDFTEAFALYQQAADRHGARHGADSLAVAAVLSSWGSALLEHGDLTAALDVLERARAISERELGVDHPEAAKDASNVAHCLMELGRHQEARVISQRTLEVFTAVYGERSELVGVALTNLTEQHRALGEIDRAIELGQRTLAVYQGLGDDLGTARALANLGLIERMRGKLDEAATLHLQALAIAENKLADRKSFVAALLNLTSGSLLAARRLPEALALSRRSLVLAEETLGKDNPQLVYPLLRLGEALTEVGQAREAVGVLERALRLAGPTIDPEAGRHLHYELGRALGITSGRGGRARALVQQARDAAAAATDQELVTAADAWLAGR